jgi:hypothetical protein
LHILQRGSIARVEPSAIVQVHECQMADQVHHGDETFHLIRLVDAFWLFGPMIDGALGAVTALLKNQPGVATARSTIERIPRRMRDPGKLGLRLWPIAGLGCYPLAELTLLGMGEVSDG